MVNLGMDLNFEFLSRWPQWCNLPGEISQCHYTMFKGEKERRERDILTCACARGNSYLLLLAITVPEINFIDYDSIHTYSQELRTHLSLTPQTG